MYCTGCAKSSGPFAVSLPRLPVVGCQAVNSLRLPLLTRQHIRGQDEIFHSGSVMNKRAKRQIVAGCLRAAAESGVADNWVSEKF